MHMHTHTHLSGTTRVSRYQKKPSPTHTHEEEAGFAQTMRPTAWEWIEPVMVVRTIKPAYNQSWLAQLQAAPTTDYWSVGRQYMQYLLLRRTQNSLHPLSTSSTTACHPFLSYDQLWAASLIGRNADVEHYHMLTASRSPRVTLQCHPGWRHVTFTKCKRKIYYTLFLFTFCFFWHLTVSFY